MDPETSCEIFHLSKSWVLWWRFWRLSEPEFEVSIYYELRVLFYWAIFGTFVGGIFYRNLLPFWYRETFGRSQWQSEDPWRKVRGRQELSGRGRKRSRRIRGALQRLKRVWKWCSKLSSLKLFCPFLFCSQCHRSFPDKEQHQQVLGWHIHQPKLSDSKWQENSMQCNGGTG